MSNISTYKRYSYYTRKDGTEVKKTYDFQYHRKLPKFTTLAKSKIRRDVRKEILNINDGEILTRLKNFMNYIQSLDIDDALSVLDSAQTVISEEIQKIDDEDLPPQNSISEGVVSAITC
jgi:hypothetical protein